MNIPNFKVRVTPDQSRIIQERIFQLGGLGWANTDRLGRITYVREALNITLPTLCYSPIIGLDAGDESYLNNSYNTRYEYNRLCERLMIHPLDRGETREHVEEIREIREHVEEIREMIYAGARNALNHTIGESLNREGLVVRDGSILYANSDSSIVKHKDKDNWSEGVESVISEFNRILGYK